MTSHCFEQKIRNTFDSIFIKDKMIARNICSKWRVIPLPKNVKTSIHKHEEGIL